MKTSLQTGAILLFLGLTNLQAAVLYVDLNCPNPTPPYADWSTAATTIQDAVDAASAGDVVLVTNGVYQTGGRPAPGEILTNRVLVTNALTLQSINGPAVTVISGYQVPGTLNGDTSVRCAHLADGSRLSGFTLANGATRQITNFTPDNEGHGGGVWCQSTNVTVFNCVILSNCCSFYGGGAYSGNLSGCQLVYNGVRQTCLGGGGGAAYSAVSDSTLRSNYLAGGSITGGGAISCVLSNSVIEGHSEGGAYNCALYGCSILNNTNFFNGAGVQHSVLEHCTLSGNRAGHSGGGAYNCRLDNCLVSSNWAGFTGGGVCSDGYQTNALGQNNQVCGNSAVRQGGGVYLTGGGSVSTNRYLVSWMVLSNVSGFEGGGVYQNGSFSLVDSCTFAGNSSGSNGGGFCSASSPVAVVSNSTLSGNLALNNGGGAYNAALVNCSLVGNRAANGGGAYGMVTNCVLTDNVASGNGGGLAYNATGSIVPGCSFTNNSAANGGGAYGGIFSNCVFSANSATTNGGAAYGAALNNCLVISNQAAYGGGLFEGASPPCYPLTPFTYLECKILGNAARTDGGGLYSMSNCRGTNCLVEGNTAANNGGGLLAGFFIKCTVDGNSAGANGGGACNAVLSLCVISNNSAGFTGGGTYNSGLGNCLLTGNLAAKGGGAYMGALNNSTVVNNQATVAGGGSYFSSGGSADSCLIYANSAPTGPNYSGSGAYSYCCTAPLLSGTGNIANDPCFVNAAAGNYRLQTNSPCINAGNGQSTPKDLDNRLRVVGGKIDIGAYEFQGPGMGEFIPWLQQCGLPIDGSADYADPDRDGANNWQEWVAGTAPTNAASVLKILPLRLTQDSTGTTISWQSVTNRTYFLQRSEGLLTSPAFSTIQSNIVGQFNTTSYADTNAPAMGQVFYRVGVQ